MRQGARPRRRERRRRAQPHTSAPHCLGTRPSVAPRASSRSRDGRAPATWVAVSRIGARRRGTAARGWCLIGIEGWAGSGHSGLRSTTHERSTAPPPPAAGHPPSPSCPGGRGWRLRPPLSPGADRGYIAACWWEQTQVQPAPTITGKMRRPISSGSPVWAKLSVLQRFIRTLPTRFLIPQAGHRCERILSTASANPRAARASVT